MSKNAKSRRQRNSDHQSQAAKKERSLSLPFLWIVAGTAIVAVCLWLILDRRGSRGGREVPNESRGEGKESNGDPRLDRPTRYVKHGNLTLVWDHIKPLVRSQVQPISDSSNIRPSDYVGDQQCKDCHVENHRDWSSHPHRWMNAIAQPETIRGDFSGEKTITFRGGQGSFYREGTSYRMRYERGDLSRVYEIHQTIGSRYYQYYVGKALEGPEEKSHPIYHAESVLPFGYWLSRKTWVPVVHVHDEVPDEARWDLLSSASPKHPSSSEESKQVGRSRGMFDASDPLPLTYARACNVCHTTFAYGDMMIRVPEVFGKASTDRQLFAMSSYVRENRSEFWNESTPPEFLSDDRLQQLTAQFIRMDAPSSAIALGITCEACHLGGRFHVETKGSKPSFIPQSPHLLTFESPSRVPTGRTHANVNSSCARCHVGDRPTYAGGMATWNSTEYSDAMKGSCYSKLTCIACHNPHKAIGVTWTRSPEQDDQSCIRCHEQFRTPQTLMAHTHHSVQSEGSRCMNCHMPYINEGMESVVRTHMISSPTLPSMIEANHPNACNLCHLDRGIDWTLDHLKNWYGKTFSAEAIDRNYPSSNPISGNRCFCSRKSSLGLTSTP